MASEIEKFDPSTLMQGVRDRIKATFVSLIPDEQWEVLVQKEINAFFEQQIKVTHARQVQHSNWGGSSVTINSETFETQFRSIVWQLCSEKTVEVLKKHMKGKFTDTWPLDPEKIDEGIKEVLVAAVPNAISTFFHQVAMGYMNQVRSDIQNGRL
jgi:hypothetical protein